MLGLPTTEFGERRRRRRQMFCFAEGSSKPKALGENIADAARGRGPSPRGIRAEWSQFRRISERPSIGCTFVVACGHCGFVYLFSGWSVAAAERNRNEQSGKRTIGKTWRSEGA
uniref:Uncharacterized protein n=1 Tax=Steinernema glaseri TaxID=37863 RepID=A0A1I7Z875_9BILA